MNDMPETEDAIYCPHCYTVELVAQDKPVWATDQVERWAWVCAGCGYLYTYDEVWPIDDCDYEIAAWQAHVHAEWERYPELDMWQICQAIDEYYPFETLFAGRVGTGLIGELEA